MLRALLPPSAPCPCLDSPLLLGSFCFTHLQAMDGAIRDESPDPRHLREVGARGAAPITSCASSHAVLDQPPSLTVLGTKAGKAPGTCLGREAALGMEQESQEATLCSGSFSLTYQCQWDRHVCVRMSHCPIGCPHHPSVLVPGVEDAAAGVRLGLYCDGACPMSHPDSWMQLLARDSLQQLNHS